MSGVTILLTTQYMDEADFLADWITVIDHGEVIAEGDSNTLKGRVGSDHVDFMISQNSDFATLPQQAINDEHLHIDAEKRVLSVMAHNGASTVKEMIQRLEDAKD